MKRNSVLESAGLFSNLGACFVFFNGMHALFLEI